MSHADNDKTVSIRCLKTDTTLETPRWFCVLHAIPWGADEHELNITTDTKTLIQIHLKRKDINHLYAVVSWLDLMERHRICWKGYQWNHAAVRALFHVLSATKKHNYYMFRLDLQEDQWGYDAKMGQDEVLDGEPCGPYVPRVTDAPRRNKGRCSPPHSASSSTSSAPSAVSGLNRSSESHALRPARALFRTSRLSEEEPPKSCAPRLGCRSMPHHIVDGDYATMGDGTLVELQAIMRNHRQIGWGIEYDLKEPRHFMEDDNGLPLEPAFPISPMMQEEPVTPIYLE